MAAAHARSAPPLGPAAAACASAGTLGGQPGCVTHARPPRPTQDAEMSQATDLLQDTTDLDATVKAAELMTDLVEHEGEATLYTFDDDSVLLVLGLQAAAHVDIAAARQAMGG